LKVVLAKALKYPKRGIL